VCHHHLDYQQGVHPNEEIVEPNGTLVHILMVAYQIWNLARTRSKGRSHNRVTILSRQNWALQRHLSVTQYLLKRCYLHTAQDFEDKPGAMLYL